MKKILAVVLTLVLAAVALADIDIPPEQRVKNFPTGCCAWCAIETLGNFHGINKLKGLAARRDARARELVPVEGTTFDSQGREYKFTRMVARGDAPGTPARVREELTALGIRHKVQDGGNTDTAILTEALEADLGCAIGVRNYPHQGDYHMVTLTHLDDKICRFIDNNGKCDKYEGTRAWFDSSWSGFTVVVFPEQ